MPPRRSGQTPLALALMLALLPAQSANALEIRSQSTPGGVIQIDLNPATQARPTVSFEGRQVMLLKKQNYWRAIVGIGLDSAVGKHSLRIQQHNRDTRDLSFSITEKNYAVQRLTITDAGKVNPDPADMARIESDSLRIEKVRNSWSEPFEVRQFLLPVKGVRSSSFGVRRILNGESKRPHSGMDIAAPPGTVVTSPADGRVVELGDYFFTGNTVILDHGQGLISLYAHLQSISVVLGEKLSAGQVLGHVGATGRVTGPHLHWSIGLNGQWIDPQLLLH